MARLRVVLLLAAALYVLISGTPTASAHDGESPGASPSDSAGAEPLPENFIRVLLQDRDNDNAPVPGVTVTVATAEGEPVGEAVSDAEGAAVVATEGGGAYVVSLDEDSLPNGVELADDTDTTLDVTVRLSGAFQVAFPIGTQVTQTTPFADQLSDAVMSGIKFGLLVALAALGLSLIFGTTGLTNFAHGDLITLGALLAYVANRGVGLPVIWSGLFAVIASAAFGWVQERGLWRPLRRRGTGLIAMMIVSIGLGLLLRNIFQYTIGSSRLTFSEYVTQGRNDFGIIRLADKEIAIIVISVVAIAATCVMLMRSRLGKAMRAVSDNPALSASSGMQVDRVISSVWILGTALTGLSGVLLAINSQINFLMGFKLLLLVFAGVTLGGLGTIWGALFGSMVIGLMTEVGPLFGVPSSIKEVGALVVLILVLLIRPQGILGRRERVG